MVTIVNLKPYNVRLLTSLFGQPSQIKISQIWKRMVTKEWEQQ
jgi:hypothetical protein